MNYKGTLFGNVSKPEQQEMVEVSKEKLIEAQTAQLREQYNTDCLDAKQLQQALNVGETNAYRWLNSCPGTKNMGRRKVVPVVWVAYYLVSNV